MLNFKNLVVLGSVEHFLYDNKIKSVKPYSYFEGFANKYCARQNKGAPIRRLAVIKFIVTKITFKLWADLLVFPLFDIIAIRLLLLSPYAVYCGLFVNDFNCGYGDRWLRRRCRCRHSTIMVQCCLFSILFMQKVQHSFFGLQGDF